MQKKENLSNEEQFFLVERRIYIPVRLVFVFYQNDLSLHLIKYRFMWS